MSNDARLSPIEVVAYSPGVCNIGPAEIARRRRAGHMGLVVTVAVFAALLILAAPHWARLILVLTAGGAASGYLQAWLHFCAGFGSTGAYNFGPVGTVEKVTDPHARSRDRFRSMQIGLASLAVGLVVGIGAFLLPIR
jgi:hypothetical protein